MPNSNEIRDVAYPRSPLPKAASVKIEKPENSSNSEICIIGELRCGLETIILESSAYTFGFNQLQIELSTYNCEIKIGARLGDIKDHFSARTRTIESTKSIKSIADKYYGSLDASLAASSSITTGATAAAKTAVGGGKASSINHEDQLKQERIIEEKYYPVISNGANWLYVSSPATDKILMGQYLYNEDLCTLLPKQKSIYHLTVRAYFQPKCIVFTEYTREGRWFPSSKLSKNKLAFAKILISKYLSKLNEGSVVESGLALIAISEDRYVGPEIVGSEIQ